MPEPATDGVRRAAITGVATYVPDRVVTNVDLSRTLDTSDEWIPSRTGIRERRSGARGETTSIMGAEAVRRLLTAKGVAPDCSSPAMGWPRLSWRRSYPIRPTSGSSMPPPTGWGFPGSESCR